MAIVYVNMYPVQPAADGGDGQGAGLGEIAQFPGDIYRKTDSKNKIFII